MQAKRTEHLTLTFTIEVEVDERAWTCAFGAGDAYDGADEQARRSLVADVEGYVLNQIAQSAAATVDGPIVSADIVRAGGPTVDAPTVAAHNQAVNRSRTTGRPGF